MHDEPGEAHGTNPARSFYDPGIVWEDQPLITEHLAARHKSDHFKCSNSQRVQDFFKVEAPFLVPRYCRAFVATEPNNPDNIWGYYSLSAAVVVKENLSGADEKRVSRDFKGYATPMIRIGFMGKSDDAPKGFGSALVVDAARRVHRNHDIAAWGLMLESEGGASNKKLYAWYQAQGFKVCRQLSNSLYVPITSLIPELQEK
jgi:hypothetical protein